MTPEELLKPRYKVIADYPGGRFPVSQILPLSEPCNAVDKAFQQYPHLFRKLEWHECRKKEELPEYVRYQDEIFKAYAYGDEDVKVEEGKPKRFMAGGWIPLSSVKPATKEEYEIYNNQNK